MENLEKGKGYDGYASWHYKYLSNDCQYRRYDSGYYTSHKKEKINIKKANAPHQGVWLLF